jgi:nucleoside-diphosphate kinase
LQKNTILYQDNLSNISSIMHCHYSSAWYSITMPQQQTLILLKPDTLSKGFVGKVIARFESSGFCIRGCKMMKLSTEKLREHYAHITSKPFYPEVETFMQSLPVIAMVIEGEDVIAKMRDMLGVTDSRKAAPGTIRAEFGVDQMINVAHASDSPEAAVSEIARFFSKEELFAY